MATLTVTITDIPDAPMNKSWQDTIDMCRDHFGYVMAEQQEIRVSAKSLMKLGPEALGNTIGNILTAYAVSETNH